MTAIINYENWLVYMGTMVNVYSIFRSPELLRWPIAIVFVRRRAVYVNNFTFFDFSVEST